jgi:hypothetical protein
VRHVFLFRDWAETIIVTAVHTSLFYTSLVTWEEIIEKLQIQRPCFRFPALPDFLSSRWSEMGSTQPREDK